MMLSQLLYNRRILKRLAKALIRLHVCAGWSEAVLVAHTTLLEISCTGSNVILFVCFCCCCCWWWCLLLLLLFVCIVAALFDIVYVFLFVCDRMCLHALPLPYYFAVHMGFFLIAVLCMIWNGPMEDWLSKLSNHQLKHLTVFTSWVCWNHLEGFGEYACLVNRPARFKISSPVCRILSNTNCITGDRISTFNC